MKKLITTSFIFILLSQINLNAEAGNLGIGLHTGYGIIEFQEKETFHGANLESDSKQDAIILGGSGEYTLKRPENFYLGITIDWLFGLKDRETWQQDNVQIKTNDMKVFGQFYDLRFGYKNTEDNLYYRLYVSGGWDGLRFKRDNFISLGKPDEGSYTEDISLWRTGVGMGLGYRFGSWAVDARVAYSYYPEGKTEDSSLPQYTFDTNGTCLDVGLGVAHEITKDMSFYLGGSYTLQKLNGDNPDHTIYWKTRLELLVGMINLTHVF
jgi:hypothetical protein